MSVEESNEIYQEVKRDVILQIIDAGIQAPSGDNCQPWKFEIDNNTIHLYLNQKADESFFNVNQIASIISCGAVLENMQIAATKFGLNGEILFTPDSSSENLMAIMKLEKKDDLTTSLLEPAIHKRYTNRKPYKKNRIQENVLSELKNVADNIPGARVHILTDRKKIKQSAGIVRRADKIRVESRSLHEFLYKMIRFTDKEANEKRDGFPIKNLEAGFGGEIFLKFSKSWRVMNFFNCIGIGGMIPLVSYLSIINSSAVGLITVDGNDHKDFLKGGMALERFWLSLTKNGLFMQPMTAVTLFWLRWKLNGDEAFLEKHRNLLKNDVWDDYFNLFTDVDFSNRFPVMFFRLGQANEISCKTLRKGAAELVSGQNCVEI